MTVTEQAAPAAQDQQVQTPPAAPAAPVATTPAPQAPAAPAAPAQEPTGPWANSLAEHFSDPAQRQAVDEYLRGNVQPYVTQLEQSAKPAQELYDAFTEQPDKTLIEVTAELYGEETAKALSQYIESGETPPADAPVEVVQPQNQVQRDPEVQALIDRERDRQERESFQAEVNRVKAANPDLDIDYDLFVPFVAKAGATLDGPAAFDAAAAEYRAFAARFGGPAPATAPAPPALGSGSAAGTSPPPTQKEYANLDEALDDFFHDLHAQGQEAAPPVAGG